MDLSTSCRKPQINVTVGKGGHIPYRATEFAAGFDLTVPKTLRIGPGVVYCIDTEVSIQLPEGYGGLIKARSSYGAKGLVILGGVIGE